MAKAETNSDDSDPTPLTVRELKSLLAEAPHDAPVMIYDTNRKDSVFTPLLEILSHEGDDGHVLIMSAMVPYGRAERSKAEAIS